MQTPNLQTCGDSQRHPRHGPPLRATDLILIVATAAGAIAVCVGLVSFVFPSLTAIHPGAPAVLWIFATVPIVLGACVYVFGVRRGRVTWTGLGLRPTSWVWYVRAFWIWLLCLPVLAAALYLTQQLFGAPAPLRHIELLVPQAPDWRYVAGVVLLVGVAAPFAEELFFRGVLYGWLRARLGVFFGIGLSAALFSLAHMIAQSFVPILILGVVLAIIFERSGSLWPGIMVHGIHNTAIIAVLYTVSGTQLT